MRALLLCAAAALAGCAAPPTRAIAPAFGTSTAGLAVAGHPAWHGRSRYARRATTVRHAQAHGAHRTRPARATGPRLDFNARTRDRCDAGDAGACRMLRSMGG